MRYAKLDALRLLALIAPLAVDSFAAACALGASSLERAARRRVVLVIAGFEAAMPLIGLGLGRPLATLVAGGTDYLAAGLLVAVGLFILLADDDDGFSGRASGWPLFALALSVSLDEFIVGLGFGTLGVPMIPALVLIAGQAGLSAYLGLRLGGRISARSRDRAEASAGTLLIVAGLVIALERAL